MGVNGVPGEVLAAEERLSGLRPPAPGGDLRLEACELMLALDWLVLMAGSAFGAFSLREKRPMVIEQRWVLGEVVVLWCCSNSGLIRREELDEDGGALGSDETRSDGGRRGTSDEQVGGRGEANKSRQSLNDPLFSQKIRKNEERIVVGPRMQGGGGRREEDGDGRAIVLPCTGGGNWDRLEP